MVLTISVCSGIVFAHSKTCLCKSFSSHSALILLKSTYFSPFTIRLSTNLDARKFFAIFSSSFSLGCSIFTGRIIPASSVRVATDTPLILDTTSIYTSRSARLSIVFSTLSADCTYFALPLTEPKSLASAQSFSLYSITGNASFCFLRNASAPPSRTVSSGSLPSSNEITLTFCTNLESISTLRIVAFLPAPSPS